MTKLYVLLPAALLMMGAAPSLTRAQDAVDPESAEAAMPPSARNGGNMGDPMDPFGVTLKIGVAGQAKRDAVIDGNSVSDAYDGQAGMHFGVGLNLGDGHGFGTDLNFTIRRYKRSEEFAGVAADYKSGDFTFEPVFGGRFQLMAPLYMFVGAGPRLGVGWEKAEVGGLTSTEDNTYGVVGIRVPVQVTYYFLDWLAATFEFGIGWDIRMTAVDEPFPPNPADPGRVFLNDKGITYDIAFGLRFF